MSEAIVEALKGFAVIFVFVLVLVTVYWMFASAGDSNDKK